MALRCIVRTVLVSVTCVIAIIFPDFSVFSNLVGSILIPIVGFLVPPFLFFRLVLFPKKNRGFKWKLMAVLMVCMIIFGVIFQIVGIYATVMKNFVL
ncbi:hypothetical protein Pelo_18506 [Pelomyxa schiedti]|nr:hypothetical protein Pelo_18506 [Pelomyxa schiedti]